MDEKDRRIDRVFAARGLPTKFPGCEVSCRAPSGRCWGETRLRGVLSDLFSDVVVGTRAVTTPGHAYLFLGSGEGVGVVPAATLMGNGSGNFFGVAVATFVAPATDFWSASHSIRAFPIPQIVSD